MIWQNKWRSGNYLEYYFRKWKFFNISWILIFWKILSYHRSILYCSVRNNFRIKYCCIRGIKRLQRKIMILLTGISRTRFTASIWKKNWIFARKFRTFVLDVTTMDSRYDSSFLLHLKARCIYRCLKYIYIHI